MSNDTIKRAVLARAISRLHDDPRKYKTVGHDGIDEQALLPGQVMYDAITDNPDQYRLYCIQLAAENRRPTTRRRIGFRKMTLVGWIALVLVSIGVLECVKCWIAVMAYLWGLM